nr:MAG TPA: hypothetical protein [Caudoviricetes sp.]
MFRNINILFDIVFAMCYIMFRNINKLFRKEVIVDVNSL